MYYSGQHSPIGCLFAIYNKEVQKLNQKNRGDVKTWHTIKVSLAAITWMCYYNVAVKEAHGIST